MDNLDSLLNYVNDLFENSYDERNNLTKERIILYDKNEVLRRDKYNLENLKRITSILKRGSIILSTILSVYVSTTMILPSIDNIMLTMLSFPMVYLSSNVAINHVINDILYHVKNQTDTSLPVSIEILERTINDNEIRLREIEVSIDKIDQILSILSKVDKQINEYKDNQEVEVEFYDIKQEDKIISFNKSLKLIKDINSDKGDK